MNKSDEAILVAVLIVLALVVVIANDLLKKRAHRRAIQKRKKPEAWTENHQVPWQFVAVVIVLGGMLVGSIFFYQRTSISKNELRIMAVIAVVVVGLAVGLWRLLRRRDR